MQKIPIARIIVSEERHRKEFKNILELAQSIEEYGLIEPIVVSPREDGKFDLIAGERRYRRAPLSRY